MSKVPWFLKPKSTCSPLAEWFARRSLGLTPVHYVGGISHSAIEDAKPKDLTAGCNVLLSAVLDRAHAGSANADQISAAPSSVGPAVDF